MRADTSQMRETQIFLQFAEVLCTHNDWKFLKTMYIQARWQKVRDATSATTSRKTQVPGKAAQCKTQTRANMILSFAASISFTSFASQLPRYIFFIGMHLSFSKISWTIKPHLGGVEYEQPPLLIKQRSTGSRRQQPDAGLCADVYFPNKPADEYQHPRWLTRRMFGIA